MNIRCVILLTLFPFFSYATCQQLDILNYKNATFKITIFPLEDSPIRDVEPLNPNALDDYQPPVRLKTSSNHWTITSNYRGYVATWEIENRKLYLSKVDGWIEYRHMTMEPCPTPDDPRLCQTKTTYTYKKATLELLFPNKVRDGRVHAEWYTGELFTGGWHPGIKRSAKMLSKQKNQAKLVFIIKNGVIKPVTDKRIPSQALQPTVKTPVQSGNQQGTAAEL